MTTLAIGSSATLGVGDGGTVSVATNGGMASASVTSGGVTTPFSIGPEPTRRTFGPFAEGATITLSNSTCGAFDYDAGLPISGTRVLKATTGALTLTGGTAGVKTTLLTVPLPDGWLSDPTVRLVVEYAANYTNSANVKNYGIDIGSTAGTAVALRTQAPTTTASETTLLVVQRSTTTPARFWIAVPNNARVFGTAAGTGSTAGVLASASIDPAATGQNLYFWAQINPNTEQVTFETIYVKLEKAEG